MLSSVHLGHPVHTSKTLLFHIILLVALILPRKTSVRSLYHCLHQYSFLKPNHHTRTCFPVIKHDFQCNKCFLLFIQRHFEDLLQPSVLTEQFFQIHEWTHDFNDLIYLNFHLGWNPFHSHHHNNVFFTFTLNFLSLAYSPEICYKHLTYPANYATSPISYEKSSRQRSHSLWFRSNI